MLKLWLYYIFVVLGVFLFFHGFFPLAKRAKPNEELVNDPPIHINNFTLKKQDIYNPEFTKIILIVIDALRFDFVNKNLMPSTHEHISQNGCINRIKVEAPTVTLPRIKALMTGSIPQFIDLILNLASKEILEDSFIHSAHKNGKKLIFFGDDTWLTLFPSSFFRYEGTNSFFVRDFKEVDDNVTRNVHIELENNDWDIMILHYLGLDHIGHVYGPFSPLIPEKLKEMDNIIDEISKKMLAKNDTLVVVTGDHGMRDSGGHGGSTYSETNVPLLLLGLQCEDSYFLQTDIPVNLAVLLGLNIPSSTIGKIQKSILPFGIEKYLYVLRYNAMVLKQKSPACDEKFEFATTLHEDFLRNSNNQSALKAIELYDYCSESIRNELIKESINQNLGSMMIAFLVMSNVFFILFIRILVSKITLEKFEVMIVLFLLSSIVLHIISFYFMVLSVLILVMILITNMRLLKEINLKFSNSTSFFLIVFSIVHPVTFISSSFVEEEHQFWYFANILFILLLATNMLKYKAVNVIPYFALLVALRFLRTINSTGDKWANYPDFSDWLLKIENQLLYQFFTLFGFILVFYTQYYLVSNNNFRIHLSNFIITLLTFVFKNNDSSIWLGRTIWFLIICHASIFHRYSKIILWIHISTLLLKPYNVILLPYCIFSSFFISKYLKNSEHIVLYHIWLGNMLYFAQGHSNSLASVDVSVGYIGLEKHQPILVIGQVLCHTYTFIVLSHLLIFRNEHVDKMKAWTILLSTRLYIFIVTCSITYIFRNHLFVWSVFAPKLFIESVHVLFSFIEFSIYSVNSYLFKYVYEKCRNVNFSY